MFLLTALGACTASRIATPASSTCRVLQVEGPATYAAVDTTAAYAAMRDFARYGGARYTLLYLSTTGGHPDKNRCMRLVQRGPDRFIAYTYHRLGKVDSSMFASPWLAVPAGHFTTLCPNFTSEVHYEMLWVKQDSTTGFSLVGELVDLQGPTLPDITLEPMTRRMEQEEKGMRFLQPVDSAVLRPRLDLLQEV
ncbi:hypothetical protein [Hymenobacter negativus]|uniref:hypothetical protein n=1 Tax=Hymenobacter negativus TaxID=2795026 RepID=UPI001AAE8CE9|nr:hypothetical protein [Hymenobacter negativus]